MMVFKRKQIVILTLILVIVVVGYLQYSYRQGSTSASKQAENLDQSAVYVDNQVDNQGLTDSANSVATDVKVQSATASKAANDFFAQAKMDKEQTRSKGSESLKAITEDTNASKEARDKAYSQMVSLSGNADKEMRIETLIDKMGFSGCVALIGDDGSVDIVLKTPSLSNSQAAQVYDAVSRQANVDMGNIHIKKLF
jgi:stage III sporulation protein AH